MKEKAYINHIGQMVNPLEACDWLYNYAKRKFKNTVQLDIEQTKQCVEAFRKRYEIEYTYQSESYIKGLAYGECAKKYIVSLDTIFGMYNLTIERKNALNGIDEEHRLATGLFLENAGFDRNAVVEFLKNYERVVEENDFLRHNLREYGYYDKLWDSLDREKAVEWYRNRPQENPTSEIIAERKIKYYISPIIDNYLECYFFPDFFYAKERLFHFIESGREDGQRVIAKIISVHRPGGKAFTEEDAQKDFFKILNKYCVINEEDKPHLIKYKSELYARFVEKILSNNNKKMNDETEKEKLREYSGNGGKKGTTERGILDEYYTPDYVCEFMYGLAVKHGYESGKVLEPSCATGNIIRPIYERNDYTHIDAFEINQTSRDICKKLYPNVNIHENYFETAFLEPPRFSTKAKKTWLQNAPYDLVIGNPPYGKHVNRYSSYFSGKDKFAQVEMFFMYKSLDLLRKGGLLVFITSTNFMSTGNAYQGAKDRIGEIAELVDAYRLPKVFEKTDICTDIIVLRKK